MLIDRAYVRIAEGQMHMRCVKSATGAAPLAMLHASPASSLSLEPLMEAFGEGRSLIAFDNPCNGQSCQPASLDPEMGEFADMLARASDALGLERLALYGTHTGAHIAIEWALAEPEQVSALVLDGVALLDDATRREFLEHYAPQKVPDDAGSQFHWAWNFIRDQMFFYPHYRKDAEHRRAEVTFDARTLHELTMDVLGNLEHYHTPYEAVFRHDVRVSLKQLKLPVLILSHADGALDKTIDELSGLVRHAELAEDCGTPQAKADAINKFLEKHA